MKRLLLATMALLAPCSSYAFGLGTTGHVAGLDFAGGSFGTGAGFWVGGAYLPTFDLYPSYNVRIGINALDTLAGLIADDDMVYLGADVTVTALRVDSFQGFDGVIQPGGSLDIYSDGASELVIGGLARFGFEGGGTMMGGIYLVPGMGVAVGDVYDGAVWSGAVQFSIWFGNVGKGGGGGGGGGGNGDQEPQ